ncbi:MAG TPA: ATP-binding protein [Bacillota bacterium]
MKHIQKLHEIDRLFNQLIIFRTLKEDPLVEELLQTLEDIQELADLTLLSGWYGALLEQYPYSNNPWADHLLNLVNSNENYFSLACERGEYPNLPPSIIAAVNEDLKNITHLMSWNPSLIFSFNEAAKSKAGIQRLQPDPALHNLTLKELAEVYKKGSGLFGKYASFTWQSEEQWLKPIETPDPITFSDLIGIEYQKNILLQNTIQFIKGYPANNILLYGDRGTGKSSLIKALCNSLAPAGLRVIEVNKEDLSDFPVITGLLRNRGLKFLLYVDDLSFEPSEVHYKHLKAVLEGGLEVKPANVLIYATSNRRHLIKETFADREEDLHSNDAVQERLSLADRFGITLTFSTPNQVEYLEIVRGLAKQSGLTLSMAELEERALQWASQHNGKSGRSARQFVNQLQGELGMQ